MINSACLMIGGLWDGINRNRWPSLDGIYASYPLWIGGCLKEAVFRRLSLGGCVLPWSNKNVTLTISTYWNFTVVVYENLCKRVITLVRDQVRVDVDRYFSLYQGLGHIFSICTIAYNITYTMINSPLQHLLLRPNTSQYRISFCVKT